MTLPRQIHAVLAVATAVVLGSLLSGCVGAQTSSHYAVDVFYTDLEVGSCIESAWNDDERTDPFDFDAANFRVVDCGSEHVAQVLGEVEIPAADAWALYGTTDGPSEDKAHAWLEGVCRSYHVLADQHLGTSNGQSEWGVAPVYSLLGDPQLGFCLLYDFAKGGLRESVDVNDMLASADGLGLDVAIPDAVPGWLEAADDQAGVFWTDIEAGQCVDPYPGPDEEYYQVVDCSAPHAAQALQWVEMAPEWGGVHPGSDVAQEHADRVCAALSTDPQITIEASQASEEYLVNDILIAQCWAYRTDLAPLTGPLP